jgi:ATP phosphoribosyltransferase
VLARPRDLPALLADGALQLALLSSELLRPGQDELVALLDTGLFPLLVGLVGRDRGGAAGPVARWLHDGRVGGQDLDLARRLLARFGYHGPVRPINGTAEAWIGCGALDLAVDTWSTGATARANGLSLLRALDEATLVLAAHGRPPLPDTAARLAADLRAWLTGTLVGSGAQAT